jgi:hypothetical protein
MSLRYQSYQNYLISLNTENTENTENTKKTDWRQYFDTELGMLTNSKKYILFIETPIQVSIKIKEELVELEHDLDLKEDIETGIKKTQTTKEGNKCYINLQHIIITSIFYISHLALIIFLFTY